MESIRTEYSDRVIWINERDEPHRLDGPAIEYSNGGKLWYINGKYHREDGPAIEWKDGDKWYYLNGIRYTEEEYQTELIKLKLNRVKDL